MNFDNLPIVAYGYENTRPTERAPLMMVKLSNIGDQYPELATPLVRLSDVRAEVEALATQRQGEGETQPDKKLWLWKNFVDGRPEYWAFDNPYPCRMDCWEPQTLGEPCGYALFRPSREGRTDWTEEKVLRAIKNARPSRD